MKSEGFQDDLNRKGGWETFISKEIYRGINGGNLQRKTHK